MIKKITLLIFCLIVILLMSISNVKAIESIELPKEYVQVNIGNNSYLDQTPLTLISGTVNWNQEGKYNVIYSDDFDNIYKKEFNIISNKNNQYWIDSGEEKEVECDDINNMVDIFYINQDSYYIISNYQEENPTEPDQEKICVTYYENNQYKWVYRYYKYSRYVSAVLYNDNLIITGTVYNENNFYNKTIVLFEITKDRQIIKTREIQSNKSCFVYGLHIYDNYIYLITNTSGNSLDYQKIKEDSLDRLVILKLSYENLKILSGKVENQLENFIIYDTSFYESRLTVHITLKENITQNNTIYTDAIYEYNERLDYINSYLFNTTKKDYKGYQVTNKDICYYAINTFNKEPFITIYYLNDNIANKVYKLDLQKEQFINNVKVVMVNNDDVYLCLNYHKVTEDNFLGFMKINSEDGLQYFSLTAQNLKVISSKIYNGYIVNTYLKNNQLYNNIYNLIEINTIYNTIDNFSFCEKEITVNCLKTKEIFNENNINPNVFGAYKTMVIYKDHFENTYYFQDTLNIDLQVNVENGKTYQEGYTINFNGDATLNGVAINSNYKINDVGNYLLVINGNNGVKETFSFTISNLTLKIETSNPINLTIKNHNYYNNYVEEETNIKTLTNYVNQENYDDVIPLTLSILSFGILSFILLRKKI